MVHPNHVAAKVARPSPGKPLLPGEEPQEPHAEIFPDVTVFNEDQEQYYMAQGYNPEGHGYTHQEYPKWVGDVLVESAEEEAALKPKKKKQPVE